MTSPSKEYVSVHESRCADVRQQGKPPPQLPNGPTDFHGFVIRKTKSGETATNKAKWGLFLRLAPCEVQLSREFVAAC